VSPRRARIIHRQVYGAAHWMDLLLSERGRSVRQETAGGKVRRFFQGLADAIKKPKTYEVTGQLYRPSSSRYRQAKRDWTRRLR
jgi:hypothetical protein